MMQRFRAITLSGIAVLLALILTTRSQAQAVPAPPASQAVSQTGLLPVYGVDLRFDPSWVDGAKFPSQSSNFGVSESLQRVWDSLAPSGFNVIRFVIDVDDARSSGVQAANLCVWARSNNVKLLPILSSANGSRNIDSDFPKRTSEFIKALIHSLRNDDNRHLEAYSQILAIQIESQINHAGLHNGLSADDGLKYLRKAAAEIRGAEEKLLKDTGLSSTPLMVNASFDYELIRSRAIAGVTLTDDAFGRGYETFRQFLARLGSIPEIDIVGVDWFAGSLSAGGVERFPNLLRSVTADLSNKQIIFTTGFSTGFNTPESQKNSYALAFNNLADYRASEGIDSPFTGVIFHEATNGPEHDAAPPSARTTREMASWNWPDRADQLARMWGGTGGSDEIRWWLKKVENNFGLLATGAENSAMAPQPALEALQQIAASVSEASTTLHDQVQEPDPGHPPVDPNQPAPPEAGAIPEGVPGSSGAGMRAALKQKVQEGLMGLLDRAFEKIGNKVFGNPAQMPAPGYGNLPSDPGIPSDPGSLPPGSDPGAMASLSLSKSEIRLEPSRPRAGELVTVSITLYNQSPDRDATGLTVALLDDSGTMLDPAAMTSDVSVPRGSSQTVSLQWTPAQANTYRISVGVFDSTGTTQLAATALDPVSVGAGTSSGIGSAEGDAIKRTMGSRFAARGMGYAAIVPGSEAIRMPLGLPLIQSVIIDSIQERDGPAQAISTAFSLSNPLSRAMSDVRATLAVDGRAVQTRDIGVLRPRQNRSLIFSNVVLPQGGAHEIKLTLTGAGQRPLSGFISARVQARAVVAAGGLPGRAGQPGSNSNVRPIVPPNYRPGGFSLPGESRASGVSGAGGGARTVPAPSRDYASKTLPDLSVAAAEIRYIPVSPRPGEELTFVVTVRNNGGAKAKDARVDLVLYAGNKIATREEFKEEIDAGRAVSKKWKVKVPSGEPLRLSVSATTTQEANAKDNSVVVTVGAPVVGGRGSASSSSPAPPPFRGSIPNPQPAPGPINRGSSRADLSIATSDIRVDPSSPKPGDSVSISFVVRNVGKTDAKAARVMCAIYADGRLVDREEVSEDIKAGDAKVRKWKTKMPSARQVRIEVSSSLPEDLEARNNRASIDISKQAGIGGGSSSGYYRPPPPTIPAAALKPDLAVGDIRFSPAAPRIGEKVVFTINLRNLGKVDARGATVMCVLYADGRIAAQRQFPADVRAGSSTPLQWSALTPAATQLRLDVSVTARDDGESGNNRATRSIKVSK
jgi:hypothetical protein